MYTSTHDYVCICKSICLLFVGISVSECVRREEVPHLCRLLCSLCESQMQLLSVCVPSFPSPPNSASWQLLSNLEAGVEDICSQFFSLSLYFSHPSDPIPVPRSAPCCLRLSPCFMMSFNQLAHGGFMGQTWPCLPYNWISQLCGDRSGNFMPWCMFRNTGSLGTQEFWEWSVLGMTLSFKNQKGLTS